MTHGHCRLQLKPGCERAIYIYTHHLVHLFLPSPSLPLPPQKPKTKNKKQTLPLLFHSKDDPGFIPNFLHSSLWSSEDLRVPLGPGEEDEAIAAIAAAAGAAEEGFRKSESVVDFFRCFAGKEEEEVVGWCLGGWFARVSEGVGEVM